jgi:hypothetical protein
MKFTAVILTSLAAAIEARSLVLGDFAILDPFTSGLASQPQVWLNNGDGVSPDSSIVAFGKTTTLAGNERLCTDQGCPISFRIGQCSGTLQSAETSGAIISLSSPTFNIPRFFCGRNTGYSSGSVRDGRFQSYFICSLGDGSC